jgi:hypothetical protein
MSHSKVIFDDIPWTAPTPGLRVKRSSRGGKVLRLVEFTSGYDDQAWCEDGHTGYVLEGDLTFAYDDGSIAHAAGDAFQIEDGPADRHRTCIAPGERALVLLVEDAAG